MGSPRAEDNIYLPAETEVLEQFSHQDPPSHQTFTALLSPVASALFQGLSWLALLWVSRLPPTLQLTKRPNHTHFCKWGERTRGGPRSRVDLRQGKDSRAAGVDLNDFLRKGSTAIF